jgi:hypothetical protein
VGRTDGVEGELPDIIEQGLSKWRAARQQSNPYGHLTVAEEFEMRRCITDYERVKRNLPLETQKLVSLGIEWKVLSYLDAQQNQTTEPPWRIKGLVVDGSATQVSAHPHGMKSLSWLIAALESVTVHKVWGKFDASRIERVMYIESEDPEWMVAARIRGIAKGLGLDPAKEVPGFHFSCPGPFDFVSEEEGIRELLAKLEPNFVVLSTLQSVLAGRDWLNQKDMQDVNALIVRLSRICPFVVLTHSPWDKRQRRAAGTITQFANFAITMHYDKVKLGEGGTAIHVVGDSKIGASINNFYLKLLTEGDEDDPASVRGLVYGGEGRPKGAGKEAVLDALADDPDASTEEIAERAGVSPRYVRDIKKAAFAKKRHRSDKSAAREVDANVPSLTSEPIDVNIEADAYAIGRNRGADE